jgi:hypothetical protein
VNKLNAAEKLCGIGSNFSESYLLAHMAALMLEDAG